MNANNITVGTGVKHAVPISIYIPFNAWQSSKLHIVISCTQDFIYPFMFSDCSQSNSSIPTRNSHCSHRSSEDSLKVCIVSFLLQIDHAYDTSPWSISRSPTCENLPLSIWNWYMQLAFGIRINHCRGDCNYSYSHTNQHRIQIPLSIPRIRILPHSLE